MPNACPQRCGEPQHFWNFCRGFVFVFCFATRFFCGLLSGHPNSHDAKCMPTEMPLSTVAIKILGFSSVSRGAAKYSDIFECFQSRTERGLPRIARAKKQNLRRQR
mmetsp:Transcript_2567/g.3698  ORF Transcript_2567/g.3698 Transcript_2567/m.3698 type:complete len:106 (-) Transcript_2567:2058-2375(-)